MKRIIAPRHAAEARRRSAAAARKRVASAPTLPAGYSLVGLTEPGFARVLEREAASLTIASAGVIRNGVVTEVQTAPEHRHSFRKPAAKYGLPEGTRRCSCGQTRALVSA